VLGQWGEFKSFKELQFDVLEDSILGMKGVCVVQSLIFRCVFRGSVGFIDIFSWVIV